MKNIEFKWYKNQISDDARSIRTIVFGEEQGVMPEEDFDGSDDHSESVVLYYDGRAAATGRIIVGERGEAVIGRIACAKELRGTGLGRELVLELLRRCRQKGFDTVYVHSQTRARGFYEKLGFKTCGEIYMEANIAHINMKIKL